MSNNYERLTRRRVRGSGRVGMYKEPSRHEPDDILIKYGYIVPVPV